MRKKQVVRTRIPDIEERKVRTFEEKASSAHSDIGYGGKGGAHLTKMENLGIIVVGICKSGEGFIGEFYNHDKVYQTLDL